MPNGLAKRRAIVVAGRSNKEDSRLISQNSVKVAVGAAPPVRPTEAQRLQRQAATIAKCRDMLGKMRASPPSAPTSSYSTTNDEPKSPGPQSCNGGQSSNEVVLAEEERRGLTMEQLEEAENANTNDVTSEKVETLEAVEANLGLAERTTATLAANSPNEGRRDEVGRCAPSRQGTPNNNVADDQCVSPIVGLVKPSAAVGPIDQLARCAVSEVPHQPECFERIEQEHMRTEDLTLCPPRSHHSSFPSAIPVIASDATLGRPYGGTYGYGRTPSRHPPQELSHVAPYGHPDMHYQQQYHNHLHFEQDSLASAAPMVTGLQCSPANQRGQRHRTSKAALPDSLTVSSSRSSCSSEISEPSSTSKDRVVRPQVQSDDSKGSMFMERMRQSLFSPRSWMENPERCQKLLSQMVKAQQQNQQQSQ
eukprot:GHVS01083453.1.p1 GENE.GHVS01083453.1~~GHVS01083453.1.p1  ORF type:complete len:421 (+),score=42.62 GHVS01083453.1:388-1650(+)